METGRDTKVTAVCEAETIASQGRSGRVLICPLQLTACLLEVQEGGRLSKTRGTRRPESC